MANAVTNFVQQKYTKTTQALLQARLLAMEIANTSLIANMPNGSRLNFPRPAYSPIAQYTKYTSVTASDVLSSNEYLDIDQVPTISFNWDKLDEEDVAWDVVGTQSKNIAYQLSKKIDGDVMNAATGGSYSSYASGTTPWNFSTTGGTDLPSTAFGNAWATLAQAGADTQNLVIVASPLTISAIGTQAISSRFTLGDREFENSKLRQTRGFSGEFIGSQLYWTPFLTSYGTFAAATNITAGDTFTINGVVFTFVSPIGTTAGNVLVGNAAADTDLNLTNALNQVSYNAAARATATAASGTTFVPVDGGKQAALSGIYATLNTTTITINSIYGTPVLSRSMTTAGNKFGQFVEKAIVMERGSVELVLRDNVYMKEEPIQSQFGTRYMFMSRYGVKQFTQGAERTAVVYVSSRTAE